MKICAEQLWVMLNARKFSRPDLAKNLIRNDLKEMLPDSYLQAFGERNTASGRWRYLNLPPMWNSLNPQGGLTEWGKECGISGGMTTDQAKKLWSRFGDNSIPANHRDNHRYGASQYSYEKLRYRGSWKRRHLQGWSNVAIYTWWKCENIEWKCIARDRDSFPEWYTAHQP